MDDLVCTQDHVATVARLLISEDLLDTIFFSLGLCSFSELGDSEEGTLDPVLGVGAGAVIYRDIMSGIQRIKQTPLELL